MLLKKIPYEQQIFVCTNDRKGAKPSCGDHQGEAVFRELRSIAKERGQHPLIRVAQAKCLGQCAQGVNVMIYSGGAWYSGTRPDDVEALAEKYLPPKKDQ